MLEDGGMLEGEISEISLIDRFIEFWREQFTGAIRFENDAIIKIIYFKGGDILSASTNDRADSIDEILTRAGKVSREHVRQALSRRKENETLGDALLNLGFITRKELTWARRVQVVGVIRSVAEWERGSFTVVADYLPKRDEGTLFALPQIVVELIVTDQDRTRFERALDGGSAVYAKTDEFDEVFRRLGLNDDAEAIAREINGERTAAEVAAASRQDSFNVYKLIHALAALRVLERVEKPRVEPEVQADEFAAIGVADAADLWVREEEPVSSAPSFSFDEEPQPEAESFRIENEEPRFDFSDEPADAAIDLNLQPLEPEPPPAAEPEFAEPEEPAVPTNVPGWDVPPRQAAAIPIPGSIEGPAEAAEEWHSASVAPGADPGGAQEWRSNPAPPSGKIESARPTPFAARKAPARRSRRSMAPLLIILGVVVLGAAGWFGWSWMQSQPAAEPIAVGTAAPVTDAPQQASAEPVAEAAESPLITAVEPVPAAPSVPVATAPSAPAAAASGERARLDAMARHYASSPEGNYTVQIQILCDPGNVAVASRASDQVWFVPQTIGDRPCYRVFWGRFGTADEAQRALAAIPVSLRDRSAAVKPVPRPEQTP